MKVCPACSEKAVGPSGSRSSPILIVGEFPGDLEMKAGKPFVGGAGKVLRRELARNGLDLIQFRVCNLWLHPPNKDENCYKAGFDNVLDEAKGKEAILLLGSECADAFVGLPISEITGLQVDSPMLSAPLVFAVLQPASVFHGTLGEVRLGIKKFCERLEEMDLV